MTAVLDVALGVFSLYALLALIVTVMLEALASALQLRARHLCKALEGRLAGTEPAEPDDAAQPLLPALYRHPLIRGLSGNRGGLPAYIPSRTFAVALLEVLRSAHSGARPAGALSRDAGELVQLGSDHLERWFNDCMARASASYKRRARLWSFCLALAVAVLLNADSLHIASRLWADEPLRTAVAASARIVGEGPNGATSNIGRLLALVEQIRRAGVPLGWLGGVPFTASTVPGWLVTALAVSLGASLWSW
jgi:hypothetical protein